MADTVTTQTISDTSGIKYVVKMTNVSDGTGETLVTKVDASALTFMTEDGSRKLSKIWYSVNTNNNKAAIELLWSGSVNSTIVFLSGKSLTPITYIKIAQTNQVRIDVSPDIATAVLITVFAATAPAIPSKIIISPAK